MGDRVFTKHQFGKETNRGTAVAADTMLLAETAPIQPDRMPERIEENVGLRVPGYRSRDGDVYMVADNLNVPHLYYQALPVLFSIGLVGGVTPALQTSGQGDYLWDFDPSLTGDNTPDTITLERGDDTQAFEHEYVLAEGYRIRGDVPQQAASAPVVMETQFFARQTTPTSFTGGLSLPTTEELNAALVRMYLDTAWADLGTTEKAILRSFDIQIMTGLHPKFFGSQYRYFDRHGQSMIDFIATLTIEGDANADAIFDLMNSNARSFLRMEVGGAQIGSGDNNKLTLDMAGYWYDVIPLGGESNGNNLHNAILKGLYDPTGGKILRAQVTTNVSAI